MNSRVFRIALLALVAVVSVFGMRLTQTQLDRIKDEKQLVNTRVEERMTPRMAITVGALGAFRGIIADLLFLRMNAEKEKGNYFELMQLGELIIQLQPDMPGAITFIAWNMAYNISVTFTSHADRWRWVNRGIEVIRDEALRYNPDDPEVYHQLAWIYQHKMGQILDDANRYYKGQLALQIINVVGNSDNYDWSRLAAAPDDEDGLREFFGRRLLAQALLNRQDATPDETIRALAVLAELRRKQGDFPEDVTARLEAAGIKDEVLPVLGMLRNLGPSAADIEASATFRQVVRNLLLAVGLKSDFYRILAARGTTYRRFESDFRIAGDFPPGYREEFDAVGLTSELDFYLRSKWLRDAYKLDADRIAKMNQEYGYLDFRLPEAHAMYWAEIGLQYSPKHANLNRIIAHSLARSVKAGRLRFLTQDGYAVVMPNLDNVDYVKRMYLENLANFENNRGYLSGFENWVKDTIVILYMWGKTAKAQEYLNFLRTYEHFPKGKPEYALPVNEFALKLAAEDVGDKSDQQVSAMIFGLAVQHIEALAYDNYEHAETTLLLLKRIRQRYYEDIDQGKRIEGRKQLPEVGQYLAEAKRYLLSLEPHPELQRRLWMVGPQLLLRPDEVQEEPSPQRP